MLIARRCGSNQLNSNKKLIELHNKWNGVHAFIAKSCRYFSAQYSNRVLVLKRRASNEKKEEEKEPKQQQNQRIFITKNQFKAIRAPNVCLIDFQACMKFIPRFKTFNHYKYETMPCRSICIFQEV